MKTILITTVLTALTLFQNGTQAQTLRTKIVKSITQIEETFTTIPDDRKVVLDQLATRIHRGNKNDQNGNVVFIDKNNTNKSQLAAIWLRTGFLHYGVEKTNVLSAGTEIIQEPFPALVSLEKYGFRIGNTGGDERYSYTVKSGSEKWVVRYKTLASLNLNNAPTINIYVEPGIVPENSPGQIEVLLSSPERIASEMLYVSWRTKHLVQQIQ